MNNDNIEEPSIDGSYGFLQLFQTGSDLNLSAATQIQLDIKDKTAELRYFTKESTQTIEIEPNDGLEIIRSFFTVVLNRNARLKEAFTGYQDLSAVEAAIPPEFAHDWHIAYLPTRYGGTLLLRRSFFERRKSDALGFLPEQTAQIARVIHRRKGGLVIVAGETGSGKTTTLDALVCDLESKLSDGGMTANASEHLEIDNDRRLQFDLRQLSTQFNQPDRAGDRNKSSFFVGLERFGLDALIWSELRHDWELENLIRLAMSGVLVFAEFYAPNAEKALERLLALSSSSDLLATTLKMIIAQKIVTSDTGPTLLAEVLPISGFSDTHLRRTANAAKLVQLIADKEGFKTFAGVLKEKEAAGKVFDPEVKAELVPQTAAR